MKQNMLKLIVSIAAALLAGSALAKLPAPSAEATEKAAAAKEKAGWSDKVSAFQLCRSQDKVVAQYRKTKASSAPATAATPCQDPGPFVAQTAAASLPASAANGATAPAAAVKPALAKK